MTVVKFYDEAADNLLKFAVILAKHNGKLIFCKHKKRDTLEFPGGKREQGEDIFTTAKRELYEETGALDYEITPICIYSVTGTESLDRAESFGAFYYAEVKAFESKLHSEIEKIIITDNLPDNWTYPDIQPKLFEEAKRRGFIHNIE
ncbi:MAG: NUDIX domain-containing protein [Clostridia bacterium]|nr:NUDIX domain-containing protein [Clostridia bacterium]